MGGCAGWTFGVNEFGRDRACYLRSEFKGAAHNCKQCWSASSGAGPSPAPTNPKLSGQNGQSCFWFSNGCSIGCETCDGTSRLQRESFRITPRDAVLRNP